jgi:hypothetical protein
MSNKWKERKLKFRIWDIKNLVFLNSLDNDGLVFEYNNIWQHLDWFVGKPNRFIVNQFLNFSDKNGKDLYEGDVIKYPNPHAKLDGTEFEIGEFYYEHGVILFDRRYEYDIKSYVTNNGLIDENKIELLGNVFQNFDRYFDPQKGEVLKDKSDQNRFNSVLSSIILDEIKSYEVKS